MTAYAFILDDGKISQGSAQMAWSATCCPKKAAETHRQRHFSDQRLASFSANSARAPLLYAIVSPAWLEADHPDKDTIEFYVTKVGALRRLSELVDLFSTDFVIVKLGFGHYWPVRMHRGSLQIDRGGVS